MKRVWLILIGLAACLAAPLGAIGAAADTLAAAVDYDEDSRQAELSGTIGSGRGSYVTYQVHNPAGKLIVLDQTASTETGAFQAGFQLPADAPAGVYRVRIGGTGIESPLERTFEVKRVTGHIPVTGIELNATEASIRMGETLQLEAAVRPSNASDPSVSWASGDPSVAAVDQAGLVAAASPGTTVITATTTDGGFQASVRITVPEPQSPDIEVQGNIIKVHRVHSDGVIAVEPELLAKAAPDSAGRLVVDATGIGPSGNPLALHIPARLYRDGFESLIFRSALGSMTFSDDALKPELRDTSRTLTLSIGQREGIYDFDCFLDGKRISAFHGKGVSMMLPYRLQSGEKASKAAITYRSDAGKLETVKNGKYDPSANVISFYMKRF